jgi:hypothetical protein
MTDELEQQRIRERNLLEGKNHSELVDEILERRREAEDRETEIAGSDAALALEEAEADKYAKLLHDMDMFVGCLKAEVQLSDEDFKATEKAWRARVDGYIGYAKSKQS